MGRLIVIVILLIGLPLAVVSFFAFSGNNDMSVAVIDQPSSVLLSSSDQQESEASGLSDLKPAVDCFTVLGRATSTAGCVKRHEALLATGRTNQSKLEQWEYDIIRDGLLTLVDERDPAAALAELAALMQSNYRVADYCHPLIHEVGHRGYAKYGDFAAAMKFQDRTCISGYGHGVIEEHFSKSQDIFAAIKTACAIYAKGSFEEWTCLHGIGHGVMYYAENDLMRAIDLCETLETEFEQVNCMDGAYMENFNSDSVQHVSNFVRPDDPSYPCPSQKEKFKGACYLYTGKYHLSLHHDYVAALRWCQGVETAFVASCTAGIGGEAMKENITDPKLVEKICLSGDKAQVAPCIDGMIGLFLSHEGGAERAAEVCGNMAEANREICAQAVTKRDYLYKN